MKKIWLSLFVILVLSACSTPSAEPAQSAANSQPTDANQPAAAADSDAVDSSSVSSASSSFLLEAWADNWFAAYNGDQLIIEDSVSITTERSFNAETARFEASYPLVLNVIMKDFKENDTGLEYIGTDRQQMGDGGFIMQITDESTGQLVAVTNSSWSCLVIHDAPADKSCENVSNPEAGVGACAFTALDEPAGWMDADFNASGWDAASEHASSAVGPKDGYDEIQWDSSAQFIWGPDLETNNTVLCRLTVQAP